MDEAEDYFKHFQPIGDGRFAWSTASAWENDVDLWGTAPDGYKYSQLMGWVRYFPDNEPSRQFCVHFSGPPELDSVFFDNRDEAMSYLVTVCLLENRKGF